MKNALNQPKFYNNFFARFHVGKKWIVAPMADFGMIRNPTTQQLDQWYAYGGSLRFAPVEVSASDHGKNIKRTR